MKLLQKFTFGLMAAVLFIGMIGPTVSASASKESSGVEQKYEILNGGDKQKFLNVLRKSDLYKDKVSHKNVERKDANVINLGKGKQGYSEEVIMVNTLVKNPSTHKVDVVYAFIGKDTKKILKLSHFNIEEKYTNYKDYDENGTLRIHQKYTTKDFNNNNLDNPLVDYTYDSGITIAKVSDFWIKFACGFGGLYSCSLACLAGLAGGPAVAGVCQTMCSLVWGAALC